MVVELPVPALLMLRPLGKPVAVKVEGPVPPVTVNGVEYGVAKVTPGSVEPELGVKSSPVAVVIVNVDEWTPAAFWARPMKFASPE
jgi:hypothetical protein